MAVLAVPSVSELATFTGRLPASFGAFTGQALEQATLMFSIVTKLSAYPVDADLRQLAKNAIMELADRLLLEQPYQSVKAGPFQSETIGSYSYSRSTQTAVTAAAGIKTGLFWWDLAIDELTVAGQSVLAHGSVKSSIDGLYRAADGDVFVASAADEAGASSPPYIRIS